MSQESYPSAAYALSIVAGVFVLLAGLLLAAIGAAFTFLALGVGAVIGIFGVVWGIIILIGAVNLRSHPDQHVTWGVIILVFSLISWVGAFGGFLIGFLLGLIGGILAITWQPPQAQVSTSYMPYPPAPTPAASTTPPTSQAARFCPNCGAPVAMDATFCSHCGKQLPPA